MSTPPTGENTLGVIVGRGRRHQSDATARVIRAATPRRASLGTGFIGVGAAVLFSVRAIYGFVWFIGLWSVYPQPALAGAAWAVLTTVVVATLVCAYLTGDQLPNWMFAIFLAGLAVAVALDLAAIWPLGDIGRNATAAVSAGMALIVVVTLRRALDIIISVSVLAVVLATAIIVNSSLAPEDLASQITTFAFAVLPAFLALAIISGFRRLVQIELDRVLVQSTVSAPRFAVGMMASEELARLDLAAEELLESVAAGRITLPLDPKMASVAASLATELRLHLIEGRRETWLYHAITESDMLGKSVTLVDKASLAGLLDANQRDGLLSAAWLLVSEFGSGASGRSVSLTVGPATGTIESAKGRHISIPITIETVGIARNRVDPAIWDALRKVGQYSDSTQNSSLRVDIQCLVENPADQ
jgi:hypothetical protein